MNNATQAYRLAVLLPCYNEELTIANVVKSFQAALPSAVIYVFDNNSEDKTADLAEQAGARVVKEPRQGKGHVVRAMFERVDADVYLMVDGDDTYPADIACTMIEPIATGKADMTVGDRLSNKSYQNAARRGKLG